MLSPLLVIDGQSHPIEVINVQKLDLYRTSITVRAQAKVRKGRSGAIVSGNREAACVVFNLAEIGRASVIELRSLEETNFLQVS
jgi:hypothetical protein